MLFGVGVVPSPCFGYFDDSMRRGGEILVFEMRCDEMNTARVLMLSLCLPAQSLGAGWVLRSRLANQFGITPAKS